MNFRKVIITGGAGFIGSNYVHYAVSQHPEWEVTVLDKLTYAGNLDNLESVREKIDFVRGDIADIDVVKKTVKGACAIINFAAESHVDRSLMDPRPFVRTNVEGTLVLLEAARREKIKRFLHVSTDEVYGDLAGVDKDSVEGDLLAPRSPYAATKAAAEHIALSYAISYGLDVVITRGSNTYGRYQYPEKIIPLFTTNALEGKNLPLYGDGSAVRDYMHVEDHVAGVDIALHEGKSKNAYNLGAKEQISGVTVAKRILEIVGKPETLLQFVPDRPGHDYRYSVDPSKAEQLGWKKKWDFVGGMEQAVNWYVENEHWWRKVKQRLEFRNHENKWYAQRQ